MRIYEPSPSTLLSPPDRGKLVAQLKRHEGAKRDDAGNHIAYRCTAGALTIGYGHNLDANPVPGIHANSKLNADQAHRLLVIDVRAAEDALHTLLPWVTGLDGVRRATLANMLFNLGPRGLLSFTNTLSSIRSGAYDDAARRMLASKWATQVGNRARELAEQMRTGEWAGPERGL